MEKAAEACAISLGWNEPGTAEHNDIKKAFIAGAMSPEAARHHLSPVVEKDEGIMEKWIDCRTKAMSKMLDNPYYNGIYRTSDFFDTIDAAFIDLFKTWHNKLSHPSSLTGNAVEEAIDRAIEVVDRAFTHSGKLSVNTTRETLIARLQLLKQRK